MNGKYLHSGDRQTIDFDAAFQGFGHDVTGPDGSYSFRTIKPVTYPGRTPHIHVKVFDDTRELLTTQFYIDGHPANGRDRIFNRLSESDAKAVSMTFTTNAGDAQATLISSSDRLENQTPQRKSVTAMNSQESFAPGQNVDVIRRIDILR